MQIKTELKREIEEPTWWIISPPKDFSEFLRTLPLLVPNDSILCLEGVIDSDIEAFLEQRPAKYENEINQGFLKLHSKIYYMPVTEVNLEQFAELSERYAEPEIYDALRVYKQDKVILSWYDLPFDSFEVANEIDETVLSKFCEILGCTYIKQVETA